MEFGAAGRLIVCAGVMPYQLERYKLNIILKYFERNAFTLTSYG